MEKKNDRSLAAAIIVFWLLVGAYFVGQRYLAIEGAADTENSLNMITVTPDKLNKKVLNAELLKDPAFLALTKNAVSRPDAQNINAGNRSPFAVPAQTTR